MKVRKCLIEKYPKEIVDHILSMDAEVENNFRLEKWKPSELDAGHFVEAVRRLVENELFGSYVGFDEAIVLFNQTVLNKYETATDNEAYRIMIPRTLCAMYCIRNKRGVSHISSISPNKIHANFILSIIKWVLEELVRIACATSPHKAQNMVDVVIDRQVDLVWDDGGTFIILNKK